jgi:hypothetical protein
LKSKNIKLADALEVGATHLLDEHGHEHLKINETNARSLAFTLHDHVYKWMPAEFPQPKAFNELACFYGVIFEQLTPTSNHEKRFYCLLCRDFLGKGANVRFTQEFDMQKHIMRNHRDLLREAGVSILTKPEETKESETILGTTSEEMAKESETILSTTSE